MQGDPGSDPRVRELREEIASTDHEIVRAVNRRIDLVRRLREHKAAMGYDFIDKGREEALLAELEPAVDRAHDLVVGGRDLRPQFLHAGVRTRVALHY